MRFGRVIYRLWHMKLWIISGCSILYFIGLYGSLHFTRYMSTLEEQLPQLKLRQEFGSWSDVAGNSTNRRDDQISFLESFASRTNTKTRLTKSILLVGRYFFNFDEAQREIVDEKCPITKCTLTLDYMNHRRSVDAVVMFSMDSTTLQYFLPKPAHQVWIADHWESPLNNRIDTVAMRQYVNWSSSYRHDSHLVSHYGRFERLTSDSKSSSTQATTSDVNYAAGKTRQVAWLVSNCNDKNGRRHYAIKLSSFINVDMYGACGALSCPFSKSAQCYAMLEKYYKFYLAFENSNCQEYMTEKVFRNAMRHDVIPIVMGARPEDYANALPPHSYIHVDDFRSPRDLADYLHVLDKNDTLYNEYFRWKSEWKPKLDDNFYWCRLCGLLHVASEQNYVHWYTDYRRWWDGEGGSTCGSPWTETNGVRWQKWT